MRKHKDRAEECIYEVFYSPNNDNYFECALDSPCIGINLTFKHIKNHITQSQSSYQPAVGDKHLEGSREFANGTHQEKPELYIPLDKIGRAHLCSWQPGQVNFNISKVKCILW